MASDAALVAFGTAFGAVLSFGVQYANDRLKERREERADLRRRRADAEEAERQRRKEAKERDQVAALAAAVDRIDPIPKDIKSIIDSYEFLSPETYNPDAWWPELGRRVEDVRNGWEGEWRYVIFGAGRLGEQLCDRANDLHSVIQTARYQVPDWID